MGVLLVHIVYLSVYQVE